MAASASLFIRLSASSDRAGVITAEQRAIINARACDRTWEDDDDNNATIGEEDWKIQQEQLVDFKDKLKDNG